MKYNFIISGVLGVALSVPLMASEDESSKVNHITPPLVQGALSEEEQTTTAPEAWEAPSTEGIVRIPMANLNRIHFTQQHDFDAYEGFASPVATVRMDYPMGSGGGWPPESDYQLKDMGRYLIDLTRLSKPLKFDPHPAMPTIHYDRYSFLNDAYRHCCSDADCFSKKLERCLGLTDPAKNRALISSKSLSGEYMVLRTLLKRPENLDLTAPEFLTLAAKIAWTLGNDPIRDGRIIYSDEDHPRSSVPLTKLPLHRDVLNIIFGYLPYKDVVSMAQTCEQFSNHAVAFHKMAVLEIKKIINANFHNTQDREKMFILEEDLTGDSFIKYNLYWNAYDYSELFKEKPEEIKKINFLNFEEIFAQELRKFPGHLKARLKIPVKRPPVKPAAIKKQAQPRVVPAKQAKPKTSAKQPPIKAPAVKKQAQPKVAPAKQAQAIVPAKQPPAVKKQTQPKVAPAKQPQPKVPAKRDPVKVSPVKNQAQSKTFTAVKKPITKKPGAQVPQNQGKKNASGK